MASGQNPKKYPTTELKSKLLRPALTSTYAVYFNVAEILGKGVGNDNEVRTFFNNRQANIESELLTLSCSEASLPGSSLATAEINNDYTGVTERHVYRRLYDDRTDFTFYVDYDYKVIKFFETWMSWIVGETQYTEQSKQTYNYRVKFPNDYNVNMHIQKFEKDFSNKIEYTFIGAYPISINSIPVSYDSSQLLKCTVSFTYKRYYLENVSQIIFGVDSRDSLVSIQDVPQGSRIIGSKDINNNQRQFQYLTPDGNILTTVDRIIR
mgnify:CR=1 FL=1